MPTQTLDDVLKHHGVKGMRWGVRKDRSSGGGSKDATPVTVKHRPGEKKLKTSGGENYGPSEDATKAAAYRQAAKTSGTHALTNDQLKHLVDRMALEQRYSKILAETNQKKGARKFLEDLLKNEADTLAKGKKGPVIIALSAALAAATKKGSGKHRK